MKFSDFRLKHPKETKTQPTWSTKKKCLKTKEEKTTKSGNIFNN